MRLISLLLALGIISALVIYNKDALFSAQKDSDQTVEEQAKQIIDDAKQASRDLQKQFEQQQKRFEELEK